jgi:hypothetical protein
VLTASLTMFPANGSASRAQPGIDSIRSHTYEDQNSGAHIDIDLIARPDMEGDYSYLITSFGWAATEPRL